MSNGILSGEGQTVQETSVQVHAKWLYMFILLAVLYLSKNKAILKSIFD